MAYIIHSPHFPLGKIAATPRVLEMVPKEDIQTALERHAHGDWGIMPEEDKKLKERAVKVGDRVFSAYRSRSDIKFWIITEWDRSVTTVLLPEDY